MATAAVYPRTKASAGLYEAFFLRAYSPLEPVGVWIRHTVHKPPGRPPRGSVWCTVFDARRGRPSMHKLSDRELSTPAGRWIAVGEDAVLGPRDAQGSCGDATWSLSWEPLDAELRHLSPAWLYRSPLPRTKLTSPAPAARFDGVLELAGREPLQLSGWPGMVGHNWGAEHAERWIWLHAAGFEEAPEAWLELALGRLLIGGRMTPWVANGALSLGGARHRLGGLRARGLRVAERPEGCALRVTGERGLRADATVQVPAAAAAGWRYSDPRGGEHDVVNCSVAQLELSIELSPGSGRRVLHSAHGAAYELGMRERTHGVELAPFADG